MGAYDYEPMEAPSQYLKLTEKGDTAKVRIVSEPYVSLKVWKESEHAFMDKEKVAALTPEQLVAVMGNPDFSVSEVFTWKVIDRKDRQAKVLSMPASVFKKIKKYAQDGEWGDPTSYDITVERVEDPGTNYWGITPSPNKKPLTDEEAAAAEKLDVAKLVVGAASLDDPDALRLPTVKAAADDKSIPGAGKDAKANVAAAMDADGAEDIANLDEIPF